MKAKIGSSKDNGVDKRSYWGGMLFRGRTQDSQFGDWMGGLTVTDLLFLKNKQAKIYAVSLVQTQNYVKMVWDEHITDCHW